MKPLHVATFLQEDCDVLVFGGWSLPWTAYCHARGMEGDRRDAELMLTLSRTVLPYSKLCVAQHALRGCELLGYDTTKAFDIVNAWAARIT
jgi:hypothetical protein